MSFCTFGFANTDLKNFQVSRVKHRFRQYRQGSKVFSRLYLLQFRQLTVQEGFSVAFSNADFIVVFHGDSLAVVPDNLTVFAGEVFNYCLDISRNIEEEADYMRLTAWAEEIEGELDKEVERYTGLVYAWYVK